jgi:hypothetical protein
MSGAEHPSRAALEAYVVDAAPRARAAIDAHVPGCARCAARVEALRAHRDAFLVGADPTAASVEIVRRFDVVPRARVGLGSWAPLAALAAGLVVAVLVRAPGAPEGSSVDPRGDRAKGRVEAPPPRAPQASGAPRGAEVGGALELFVEAPDGLVAVPPGTPLAARTHLRLRAEGAGRGFVAVLSVDSSGQLSTYYPASGDALVAFAGGAALLPGAVELDAARGPERVVAIFADAPLPLEPLRARLRAALDAAGGQVLALDLTSLGDRVTVASTWFDKE